MNNYQNLEQQMRTLRRRVTGLAVALILTLGYVGLSSSVRDAEAQSTPQELTLRRLTIVDEKGVQRVVIAAPAPDPIVQGKREKRQGEIAGILIYDKDGNERAGYATANDPSNGAMLTLDATDAQVFTVYANAANGATLSLNSQKGDGVTLTTWNQPRIQIRQARKILYLQPSDAPEVR
jgi:hypothetical protein